MTIQAPRSQEQKRAFHAGKQGETATAKRIKRVGETAEKREGRNNPMTPQGLRIDFEFGICKYFQQIIGVEGTGHALAFGAALEGLFLT